MNDQIAFCVLGLCVIASAVGIAGTGYALVEYVRIKVREWRAKR